MLARVFKDEKFRKLLKERREKSIASIKRVRNSPVKIMLILTLVFNSVLTWYRVYNAFKPAQEKIGMGIENLLTGAGIMDFDHHHNKTAADQQQELMYAFLRQIALGPNAVNDHDEPVKQRFVLQIPGKILNPDDYDPKDPSFDDTLQRFVSFIPPRIFENMFRLADVVPVANPIKGGETGESFSEIYEKALGLMDIRSFDKMSEEERARYDKAIAYLAEMVPDPQNATTNASRFLIYSKLRKKYDDFRLEMEEKMKEVEDTLSHDPIEYQRWFQIYFPMMQAELEDVYTEWLVFGEKDVVELYKAYLDVGSHVADLQKARMSLRSSNKASLDRSSVVYPVHFEPSDWYEYLRPRKQSFSLKHLEMQLGDIDAKLTTLKSMVNGDGIPGAMEYIQTLREEHAALQNNLTLLTQEVGQKKLACIATENDQIACDEYRNAQSVLMTATKEYAMKRAHMSNTRSFLYTDDVSKKTLLEEIKTLEIKRQSLLVKQKEKQKKPNRDKSEDESAQHAQYGWTEFQFSSVESKKQMHQSTVDYASAINLGTGRKLWSFSGGSSDEHSAAFQEKINKNEFRVKGKILKVTISRPWFKSSLFKSRKIKTRDDRKISPGPMSEKNFVKTLNKDTDYILPEFTNAFLLAKDIELEFVGVDARSQSYALEQSAKGQLSGSLGCFSVSSSSFDHSETRMEAESTVNGLKIKVPGAQIIGYFTTVLPCFPQNLCRKWGIF